MFLPFLNLPFNKNISSYSASMITTTYTPNIGLRQRPKPKPFTWPRFWWKYSQVLKQWHIKGMKTCYLSPLLKSTMSKGIFPTTYQVCPRPILQQCLTGYWLNILTLRLSGKRLVVHDYQQTELQHMRSMDNTKLVDSIELNLKSCKDLFTAVKKILASGLEVYLGHFVIDIICILYNLHVHDVVRRHRKAW